jgi:membrane-associated PAP2 superfamily phosphatase
MNRNGAFIALAIGGAVGLLFGVYPELDLEISRVFFDPHRENLWLGITRPIWLMRTGATWLVALIAAPAFVALGVKVLWPRRPALLPGRAVMLMIVSLALAPGLLANGILKERWGRPRPIDVTAFHGTDPFLPWWDPRGPCPKNCSFIAGEPSGAFWTLAAAVVAPPPWRLLASGAALAFGAADGLIRMAAGGHFFTDLAFAGAFTFLIIWVVHGILYRWRPTRVTDAAVERIPEMLAMTIERAATWIAGRTRRPDVT